MFTWNLKKKVIGHLSDKIPGCFIKMRYYDVTVHTYIYQYHWLWFTWYRYKQIRPKFISWFDGEYRSKQAMKSVLFEQKYNAKTKILRYKIEKDNVQSECGEATE